MSFTPCVNSLAANITSNCQPNVKGFKQLGAIVNKKDVVHLKIINGVINSYSPFNAKPIYQLRQNPKPFNSYKVEYQAESNTYKKTIQFYFEGIGAGNAKDVIEPLKDNEFMIIIESKKKSGIYCDKFIFIGAQNGLHVTEMVEDEETGYWLVTMECEEPHAEISMYALDMENFVYFD